MSRKPDRYFQRELSWLRFNERVLEEALDPSNPLLERLNFLAIFVSNLDEFHMVRVAGLRRLLDADFTGTDETGHGPARTLEDIRARVHGLISRVVAAYEHLRGHDLPQAGVLLLRHEDLKEADLRVANEYFRTTVFPLMTPMAVDPGHPFPVLPSKTLFFAVQLERGRKHHLAIVPVPTVLARIYPLPPAQGKKRFVLLDEIIRGNMQSFFRGYGIREAVCMRLLRDGDLEIGEEYADDLLKAIERQIKRRPFARPVYMEVEKSVSPDLLARLCKETELPPADAYRMGTTPDLSFLGALLPLIDRPGLRYPAFTPSPVPCDNLFDRIRRGPLLLHHPYQSFLPVIELLRAAARDPQVLAVKMTLYRIHTRSAIVAALQEAAAAGKQVTVLVELKARFDEEKNIGWARELERSGCHVIYGIPGIKIHSKILLIVRLEDNQIRRYMHLSTGNYNERTAFVYTDLGLFTADEDMGRDISEMFNVISGYSMPPRWRKVTSAPYDLRGYLERLIDNEIDNQKRYGTGRIFAKVNSLSDPAAIDKLYEASQSGVSIRLLVRGICCLVPGVPGQSENIEVRSLVGRFLEHSRIYCFHCNGQPRFFLSSADLMSRNLDRRIELLLPVEDDEHKKHLDWLLGAYWKDNVKARRLAADGTYAPLPRGENEPAVVLHDLLISHYGRPAQPPRNG